MREGWKRREAFRSAAQEWSGSGTAHSPAPHAAHALIYTPQIFWYTESDFRTSEELL